MVNVAGRSKGCNTCRRRKKGCDLQKPACARCMRDDLECEGYERATVFVSHRPLPLHGGSAKVPAVWEKAQDVRQGPASGGLSSIQLREDLMTVAYQQQVFGRFGETYLPCGALVPQGGRSTLASCEWMDTILQLATTHNTLRQALCAISYSNQGSREADDYKIQQGAQCYGAAVVRLNQALRSDAVLTDEAIIPTCQLLSYYEQFNGFSSTKTHAQGRNWQAHSAGLARILQHRGPQRHKSGLALTIFRQTRTPQLAYWCGVRKACPFALPEWQEHMSPGTVSTIRDRLFDVAVAVPGLLERSDHANLPGNDTFRGPLLEDCVAVHAKLQGWLSDARRELGPLNPNSNDVPSPTDDVELFMMHGMDVAAAIMMFWAVSILLCGTMRILIDGLASEHGAAVVDEDALNARPYVSNIVKSMRHLLCREAGLIGFQSALFPLCIVLMHSAAFHDTETDERETIRRQLWGPDAIKPYGPLMGAFLSQMREESTKRWEVKATPPNQDEYSVDRHRSRIWFQGKRHETEQAVTGGASPIQI